MRTFLLAVEARAEVPVPPFLPSTSLPMDLMSPSL